ncbi:hypothetical protein LTR37_004306 [Vermiconidia calcicola]|uniref:Uncharacterized protein n=1 Tax=Vermiconidia calcicola TaxID=1690605 RepID=A0ACC3NMJ5_9PEZI|nr:hypothetical protein LTR37_004306 [Vermiconidia calcicola]
MVHRVVYRTPTRTQPPPQPKPTPKKQVRFALPGKTESDRARKSSEKPSRQSDSKRASTREQPSKSSRSTQPYLVAAGLSAVAAAIDTGPRKEKPKTRTPQRYERRPAPPPPPPPAPRRKEERPAARTSSRRHSTQAMHGGVPRDYDWERVTRVTTDRSRR